MKRRETQTTALHILQTKSINKNFHLILGKGINLCILYRVEMHVLGRVEKNDKKKVKNMLKKYFFLLKTNIKV